MRSVQNTGVDKTRSNQDRTEVETDKPDPPSFPSNSESIPLSGLSSSRKTNDSPSSRMNLSFRLESEQSGNTSQFTLSHVVGSNERDDDTFLSHDEIRSLLLTEAGYDIDNPKNVSRRTGYLPWDDYFMAVAFLSAKRSKDPNTQVGACIVDDENRIVGIGYNGFPWGCSDDCLPWDDGSSLNKGDFGKGSAPKRLLHTRDPYMCHAEVNAILNKCSADVAGARMYVAHFPCNECAKIIIQSRIKEIVYMDDDNPDSDTYRASRILFKMAGVRTRRHNPSTRSITLDFGASVPFASEEVASGAEQNVDGKDERMKYRDLLIQEADYDPLSAPITKRTGYLSWDDYFMAVAFLSAQRSKDPNTQVGACIEKNRYVLGIGYNGFPRGCSDLHLPWSRDADSNLQKKYHYVCHAEVNAILNKCSADVKGATLYVALFPCNDCAKVIIQAGIREVVYLSDQYHDSEQCRASRIMFRMSGIKLRQHRPKESLLQIMFGNHSKSELS